MAGLTAAPAEKQHLLAEVLRARGSARLRVTGTSMLPTIWPGDVAVLERVATTDLRVGDVILFQQDSRLFLHRIIAAAAGDEFATRGDAMPQADPMVRPQQILARVSAIERRGRLIRHFELSPWRKMIGLAVAHFDLAGRVALRLNQLGRGRGRSAEVAPEAVCEA